MVGTTIKKFLKIETETMDENVWRSTCYTMSKRRFANWKAYTFFVRTF